jgi:hypothetical protein
MHMRLRSVLPPPLPPWWSWLSPTHQSPPPPPLSSYSNDNDGEEEWHALVVVQVFVFPSNNCIVWHFWRIQLFCINHHSHHGRFHALVTTNASNVWIDKHLIYLQVRFEWLHNLLNFFQEQGRGSHQEGVKSTCIVSGDFLLYFYWMGQLLMKSLHDNKETSPDTAVKGFNFAISPCKHRMQLTTRRHTPLGQQQGAVYKRSQQLNYRKFYNSSVWTLAVNTHVVKCICQRESMMVMRLTWRTGVMILLHLH